ncbi:hypothetical protein NP88_2261 [Burkholderia cepacia]|jgi:hypothetical protein|uniref:Hypothetical phage protein n=2 Tax=Burkholderia cenocepacia TaxID=95486 RepID=B4EFR1_BURCJ|nr:hypothetical protein NP88_2261 [Burkholderia cepacia]QNN06842.1 hypothetical protein K562_21070 [Burkholderia cenocepacia]CAR54910.1 hypothetical phage protein [Burkholderia cenocepacia J2315]SPV04561.1 regulatory protein Cro [Burkholderia cenocepacia]SPV06589.1 regulatory protein Cro [Burkholderia cenocepacia]
MLMDKLKSLLRQMTREEQAQFCFACGTTLGYMRKALSVGAIFGPALCVSIERESKGLVTRRDLHPNDWQDIWPELADQPTQVPA